MIKIPFEPTTIKGRGRSFRTVFTPELLTVGLFATILLTGATAGAQETVTGKPGRANVRSVINRKGTAFLQQQKGLTNTGVHRYVPPPMPRAEQFPTGVPGEGNASQPAASPAPAAGHTVQGQSIVTAESIEAVPLGIPSPPMALSFPALEDNDT